MNGREGGGEDMRGQIYRDKALAERPSPLPDDHHHEVGDDDVDGNDGED